MQKGRQWTARIGILTILEEEFAAVQAALGPLDEIPQTGFLSARSHPRDVIVKRCRDRTNHAAISETQALIENFRPEVIIVCGVAGGAEHKGVKLGDVVVADYLHYSDFRKIDSEGDHLRFIAYDQPSSMLRSVHVEMERIGMEWREGILADSPIDLDPPQLLMGSVVAGEKVMGTPSHPEVKTAAKNFQDAIAYEMESYGVARAIHDLRSEVDYNPLLVVVRGISDVVGSNDETTEQSNSDQRALWKPYACATAAALTTNLVARFLDAPDLRAETRLSEVTA